MTKRFSLSKTQRHGIIITIVLFVLQLPLLLISESIAYFFILDTSNDWALFPMLCWNSVNFVIHVILYVFFRAVLNKRISVLIIISQLLAFVISVPWMIDDLHHTSFILDNMAIWFGRNFLFQAILFIAFTIAISLFDRHTALKDWIKILIAFVLALTVGLSFSAAVWIGIEKLYHYVRLL